MQYAYNSTHIYPYIRSKPCSYDNRLGFHIYAVCCLSIVRRKQHAAILPILRFTDGSKTDDCMRRAFHELQQNGSVASMHVACCKFRSELQRRRRVATRSLIFCFVATLRSPSAANSGNSRALAATALATTHPVYGQRTNDRTATELRNRFMASKQNLRYAIINYCKRDPIT